MIRSRQDIWVEKLTPIDIIKFIMDSCLHSVSVYYDENNISALTKCLMSFLNKIHLGGAFYPARLRFSEVDHAGEALSYQYQRDIDSCSGYFCDKYLSGRPEWFRKMTRAYIAVHIDKRIRFLTMVGAKLPAKTPRRQVIFIKRHPLNYLILRHYKTDRFEIRQSGFFVDHIKVIVKSFYWLWMSILNILCRNNWKKNTNIKEIRPAVWIECEPDIWNENNKTIKIIKNSTFFWSGHVNAKDYDIVFYITRPDTPVKSFSRKISIVGYGWVDVKRLYNLANMTMKDMKEIAIKAFRFRSENPVWFHCFELENFIRYKMYRSIYERFKVKILMQYEELDWISGVQARAIEDAGGIMIGYHWSNFPFYKQVQRLSAYHVYFVWNKLTYECMKRNGNTCRHILPCGLWATADDERPARLNSLAGHVKFAIAIFDSSAGYNIQCSSEKFSSFYLLAVKLLEKNRLWGGIVKSKLYDLDNLPLEEGLIKRMKALAGEDRLIFLKPQVSPITVAACANLSISLNINSAGIVAAICGHRVVHWDCSAWTRHFFYKDLTQKFLYRSLDELERVILRASLGDEKIGDFSKWRERFNYFNDFAAPRRVGEFVQAFMDEIIRTDDMEYSLAFAAKEYIKKNRISDDFFKIENLWEEE